MKKALTNDRPFTIIKTTKEQRTKRIQGTVDNQFTSNLNPSKGGTDHQRLNFSFIYNQRNLLYMRPGETNLLKAKRSNSKVI